jgi:SAM-dependent methyltransferase
MPMHYWSFRTALEDAYADDPIPFPVRPFIIDIGCGPATTSLAILDWLEERRGPGVTLLTYLGIDTSEPLRRLGEELLGIEPLAGRCRALLVESLDTLEQQEFMRLQEGCDGVVFAASYVVHQEFMQDMSPLANLMRYARERSAGLPAWLLLQDANYAKKEGKHTLVWPEQRVRLLADLCESLGYIIRPRKATYSTPHVEIAPDGTFEFGEPPATKNVCAFFQLITP